tara:strand:+ start:1218 stop:2300 length:1083 start_codon:yes stop_codon:yes gene_type:complete
MVKKLGILTSGGDCAGLNAVLRAATHRAHNLGWQVIGIRNGTMGFLKKPYETVDLKPSTLEAGLLRLGGTILGTTNHGNPFAFPMPDGTQKDRSHEIIEAFRALGLDALIGVGGDGSHAILRQLAQQGNIPYVAIPKTIDNDVGATEFSIGFSTAVDVATEALDRLQPTAASHDRVMVLEVMGRDAGHIALAAGIAGGADIILIPEISYSLSGIKRKIQKVAENGRNFSLVVVAEAVKSESGKPITIYDPTGRIRYGGIGHYLADRITEETGAESRFMVLGHVQRGGQPGAFDRLLATAYGVKAVDLVDSGKFDRMVIWRNRNVIDVSIEEAISHYHSVDPKDALVKTAQGLGVYIGDHF